MSLTTRFVLWVFAVFAFWPAYVVVGNADEAQSQQLTFQVLLDAPSNSTIVDICCGGFTFGEATQSVRTSYGEPPVWLRVAGLGEVDLLKINLIVDEATAYFKTEFSAAWSETTTGDLVPMAARGLAHPLMVLPLGNRLPGTPIYIQVAQPVMTTLSLSAWQSPAFDAMDRIDHLFKTFLSGILFATIVYNAFVGVLLRSAVFLFNALTISTLLLLALYLSGYGAAYIWDAKPQWSNAILLLAVCSGVVFGSAFFWGILRDDGEPVGKGV